MKTPKRPRSGIVPAFVTASLRAPSRPRTSPAVRSQMMRGRSSANSSDGYRPASMSSTFSSWARERSANGYAPRTSRCRSATSISSIAQMPTICCASTSSGLRGICVSSIAPSRIRCVTTAHSSRSARNLGKMRPFETSCSEWPERPMRCRPRATDFGDSTCTTRSTAPMSMPSSSDDVATRHGIRPAFRSSSISHALLARERAVMRTRDLFLGQLVQAQREPLGEPPVVDEDDRRAVLAHELEERGIDRRPDRVDAGLGTGGRELAHVLDRHDDLQVELLRDTRVDELDRSRTGDEAPDLLERPLRRRQARSAGTACRRAARAARPRARSASRASCRRSRAPRP